METLELNQPLFIHKIAGREKSTLAVSLKNLLKLIQNKNPEESLKTGFFNEQEEKKDF